MKSTAVICGIDLGSWTTKVAVFSGQQFTILTNEANFRQTPSLVGYTSTQRLIGQPALIKLKTNYSNTIRAPQRLLGLEYHPHLLEEQLKYSGLKYTCSDDINFIVQGQQGSTTVSGEDVCISLINKVKNIAESHQLQVSLPYLAVPTYYPQEARHALQQSAEIALKRKVRLVDEWIPLSADYAFKHLKQLKALHQMRYVIFLDVGYSKVSMSLVEFTRHEGRLVDWEHLPYTGCKNMDQQLGQFYNQLFAKQTQQVIFNHPKAMVKLTDAIQKQRTILSANTEHHLNLEYLLGEEDLAYNMTRQQFEDNIVSVLSDIAAAMSSFQARNSSVPLHSIELIGGGSRIPCIQSMASKIFNLEPSRTLNQSQSIAMGSAILGALENKVLNMPYSFDSTVARNISVRWNKNKKELFWKNTKLPYQQTVNVPNQGVVDLLVYFQQSFAEKQIAKIRVKSPCKLSFTLDINKILNVQSLASLEVNDMRHKPQSKWKQCRIREQEMEARDRRMHQLYELKNEYQSQYYWCRNNLDALRSQKKSELLQKVQQQLAMAQKWIEDQQHNYSSGAQEHLKLALDKRQQIKHIRKLIQQSKPGSKPEPKINGDILKKEYEKLTQQIAAVFENPMNEKEEQKLLQVLTWCENNYAHMEKTNWEGDALTLEKIQEARALVQTIQKH